MPPTTTITVVPAAVDPAAPVPPEQLVRTARSGRDVGASVVLVRGRADGGAAPDLARLTDTVTALRETTELVVQLSLDRLEALDADPDAVSVPLGAAEDFVVELHRQLRDRRIAPVYEVAELDQLTALRRLLDAEGPPGSGQLHCQLVLGAPGGLPGTTAALVAAVQRLPEGATFSATGLGPATLPVLLATLSAGGHLRVGRADTPAAGPGEPVRGDIQLVARAAGLARIAQRPPAPVDLTRALLGVAERRPAGVA